VANPGRLEIEVISEPGFNIYPNPGNGNVTVSLNFTDANLNNGILRILNENGQVVKLVSIINQRKFSLSIDKPGIYIAQLVIGKQLINKKLVIIK
jgi:hypothetical protein